MLCFKCGPDLPDELVKEVLKAAAQSDPEGPLVTEQKGHPEPDADLRDNENVPVAHRCQ